MSYWQFLGYVVATTCVVGFVALMGGCILGMFGFFERKKGGQHD